MLQVMYQLVLGFCLYPCSRAQPLIPLLIVLVLFIYLQIYADDVLTKEEQIGLLFMAKQKCERNIKSKAKIPGKC